MGRRSRSVLLAFLLAGLGLLVVLSPVLHRPAPLPIPPSTTPQPDTAPAAPPDFGPLVDVATLDPSIVIDLRYARDDNIVGRQLYPVNRALLLPSVAERLVRVQARLREHGYGLKVWDAYRPPWVQRELWAAFPDPRYVADPARGSNHSRGAAVDATLVHADGNELEMPGDYDDFELGRRDHPAHSELARRHLEILTEAMVSEGFIPYEGEWWHFNAPEAARYPILDIPLEGS